MPVDYHILMLNTIVMQFSDTITERSVNVSKDIVISFILAICCLANSFESMVMPKSFCCYTASKGINVPSKAIKMYTD